MSGAGQDAAHTEQQQDECIFERNRGDQQYRQDADDALCPPYVRLFGGGVRNADRRAGKDSRPLQYEHDPALREVLRTAYRTRDAEDRRGARCGKLTADRDGQITTGHRSLKLLGCPVVYLISFLFIWFFRIIHFAEKCFEGDIIKFAELRYRF